MHYGINIRISQKGLQNIYAAGMKVTLVKSIISNPMPAGNLPIAWVSFQPLMENNVSWETLYHLYGTTTALQDGVKIVMTSQTETPAQLGWLYTFQNGFFTGAQGGGDTFNIANQMQSGSLTPFSFGLAQQAIVNNVKTFAPLNAVPVLYNNRASFTPQEKLSVFLSSYSDNGTVISQVASDALGITLTSQSPIANVGFNDANNTFYLQSAAQVLADRLALR